MRGLHVIGVIGLIAMSSCAPFGPGGKTALPALTPGTTSIDDAIVMLGQPTTVSVMQGGDQLLQWSHARATKGRGAGRLAVQFDSRGVMVRVARYQAPTRAPRGDGR